MGIGEHGDSETMRLFIAVQLDAAILRTLADWQAELRGLGGAMSWARPDGMHLTLKFLGDTDTACLPRIGEALAAVAATGSPFRMTLGGTGGFPSLQRPRVLWVGVQEGTEALCDLARGIDAALAPLGIPRETRPWRPHLTLGRVKAPEGLGPVTARLREAQACVFGAMDVEEVILFRSTLHPTGAEYTPMRTCPLGADTWRHSLHR